MKKISQKQMVFYKLFIEWKNNKKRFVPAWEFGGEMFISELDRWVLMSYKCPTRLTDIFQENPALLEREMIEGKSGASYYGYRIRTDVGGLLDSHINEEYIIDKTILSFYNKIKQ